MMKYLIITVLAVLTSGIVNAQKSSVFLGHKNVFEANYSVYSNLVSMSPYYKREGSQLVIRDIGIHHGLQLAYTRHLVGKMAFGLEFDYTRTIYAPDKLFEYTNGPSYPTNSFNIEKIDMNCMAFIGKFEFGRKGSFFPIGVSHQVGGGLLLIGSKTGSAYAVSNSYLVETREIDYTLESAKGFTAFYNLNFRASLSDRLLLNFGLRYNANYIFRQESSTDNKAINEKSMAEDINNKLGMNLMRFYTGLGFSF